MLLGIEGLDLLQGVAGAALLGLQDELNAGRGNGGAAALGLLADDAEDPVRCVSFRTGVAERPGGRRRFGRSDGLTGKHADQDTRPEVRSGGGLRINVTSGDRRHRMRSVSG